MTQKYGYIRVSSKDQNLWRQIDAMTAQGICEENIFTDKITGGTFVRPGYEALLKIIKKEDILFIHGIDRLGRNYDEIMQNQRIIAGNAQFTGIAAGRGVGFTTGLLLLREGLGMRETPIRPHSWH